MSKISDIIEEFILEQLDDDGFINLSRNELANFFNCAPSQINYVLSTRFTEPKGFVIESHRGGGGYIRLGRVNLEKSSYVKNLLSTTLNGDIDYHDACGILDSLVSLKVLSEQEAKVLKYAITPKALSLPVKIENKQRANIIKNVLINMLKEWYIMLCDKCKKNEANYYRKTIINGVTTEQHLCSECAKKVDPHAFDFERFGNFDLFDVFDSKRSLLDFDDDGFGFEDSFFEPRNTGLIGDAMKSISVGAEKFKTENKKRNPKLDKLKSDLRNAVEKEDYEKAAKLKKEIESLENPKNEDKKDDNKKDDNKKDVNKNKDKKGEW